MHTNFSSVARVSSLVFGVALLLGSAARGDSLLNVDFNSFEANSPTYSGAAVIGGAGDVWNGISADQLDTSLSASNLALKLADGTSSGITLSYTLTAPGSELGGFDVGSGSPFNGVTGQDLMRDYFFARSGSGSFTLNGLTAGGSYELILYSGADSKRNNAADGRNTAFTVNGSTQNVIQGDNSTFIANANYTEFDVVADGTGSLTFTMAAGDPQALAAEPDINGFQLLSQPSALPLPGSAWGGLALLGGLAIVSRGRRQQIDAWVS